MHASAVDQTQPRISCSLNSQDSVQTIGLNSGRNNPQQLTLLIPNPAAHGETRLIGSPSDDEFTHRPLLPFLNSLKKRAVTEIKANVGSRTGSQNQPLIVHPEDAPNCGIISLGFIKDSIPIPFGNLLRSRKSQPDNQFSMNKILHEYLEVLCDCASQLKVGPKLFRLPCLKSLVVNKGLYEEDRKEYNQKKQK
jgi:hypothetical protein